MSKKFNLNNKYKNTKIVIRMEREGKYTEQRLKPSMVCALFDLQFMLDDVWHTLKLNKLDKDMAGFFEIIDYLDDSLHGSQVSYYNTQTKRWKHREKTKKDYPKHSLGKPKWGEVK